MLMPVLTPSRRSSEMTACAAPLYEASPGRQRDLAGQVLGDHVVALLQHLLDDGRQRRRGHAGQDGGVGRAGLGRGGNPVTWMPSATSRLPNDSAAIRAGSVARGRRLYGSSESSGRPAGVSRPWSTSSGTIEGRDVAGATEEAARAGRQQGAGVQRGVVGKAYRPVAAGRQRLRRGGGQAGESGRAGVVLGRELVDGQRRVTAADQDDAVRRGPVTTRVANRAPAPSAARPAAAVASLAVAGRGGGLAAVFGQQYAPGGRVRDHGRYLRAERGGGQRACLPAPTAARWPWAAPRSWCRRSGRRRRP